MSDVSAGTEAGLRSGSASSHHALFAPGRRTILVGAALTTAGAREAPETVAAKYSVSSFKVPSGEIEARNEKPRGLQAAGFRRRNLERVWEFVYSVRDSRAQPSDGDFSYAADR